LHLRNTNKTRNRAPRISNRHFKKNRKPL